MAVKTEVIAVAPKAGDPKFPLLAKDTNSDLVVLFTDIDSGTVVQPNDSYDMGHHYDGGWGNVDDDSEWIILPRGSQVRITQD